MTWAKIAFAQRILRTAIEKRAEIAPTIATLGKVVGGAGKLVGKGAWGLAGVGARGMGVAQNSAFQIPARAGILGMAGLGTYSAGKEGVNAAKASFRGFDPNVQGASRVRTNPQYAYQEVG